MTSVGPFQRWYDIDLALSETVKTLESLSHVSQTLFGLLMNHFSDRVVSVRGHAFYTQLDWSKLQGLAKSKRSRRWYDQEALMHKAFNKLYSLSDSDRILIARELHTPIQLVRRYEEECLSKSLMPEVETVYSIVESCFVQELKTSESHHTEDGMDIQGV